MATANPFNLLEDSENEDPSLLLANQQKKLASSSSSSSPAASTPTVAKLPSKPLPPAQAVRESRNNAAAIREGAGRRGGRGGRGGLNGQNRDFENGGFGRFGGGGRGGFLNENGEGGNPPERGRGGSDQYRGSFRGGRRGGHLNGEGEFDSDHPQRRVFERRSGSGIGFEMKKEGAGRGNWGTVTDEVVVQLRFVVLSSLGNLLT